MKYGKFNDFIRSYSIFLDYFKIGVIQICAWNSFEFVVICLIHSRIGKWIWYMNAL